MKKNKTITPEELENLKRLLFSDDVNNINLAIRILIRTFNLDYYKGRGLLIKLFQEQLLNYDNWITVKLGNNVAHKFTSCLFEVVIKKFSVTCDLNYNIKLTDKSEYLILFRHTWDKDKKVKDLALKFSKELNSLCSHLYIKNKQ
jgi:hypothetical protein